MNRSVIDRLVSAIATVVAVALLLAAALLFVGHNYVHSQVRSQLAEQNISFPAAGSGGLTSLPPADQAVMAKYAGQQMTNGAQAEAFADHFIKVHLGKVAGGKTYAEVSAAAQAAPTDTALAGQVQTLFRGETLRGLLLNAYAFDTMGNLALIAAWAALVAGLLLLALSFLGIKHAKRVEVISLIAPRVTPQPLPV